jgi:hypothetical protein
MRAQLPLLALLLLTGTAAADTTSRPCDDWFKNNSLAERGARRYQLSRRSPCPSR